jgi:hypothetical protein
VLINDRKVILRTGLSVSFSLSAAYFMLVSPMKFGVPLFITNQHEVPFLSPFSDRVDSSTPTMHSQEQSIPARYLNLLQV